jgi:hypothetical protein
VRGALVLVPALIGFFGMVWLLSRPWQRAHAKSPPASPAVLQAPIPGTFVKTADKAKPGAIRNYALAANGATITGGSRPEELIDGNDSNYSGGTGFATSVWSATPPQAFVITLKEPYAIDYIRILLWDRDDRFYRYKLEICPDAAGTAWTVAADYTGPTEQRRGWQVVRFKPQPVKLIRLTGAHNSSNSGFHAVEVQASMGVPANVEPTPSDSMDF